MKLFLCTVLFLVAGSLRSEIVGPANKNGFSYKVDDSLSYYNQKLAVDSGLFLGEVNRPVNLEFPDYDSNITDHVSKYIKDNTVDSGTTISMAKQVSKELTAGFLEDVDIVDVVAPVLSEGSSQSIYKCLAEIKESYEAFMKKKAVDVIDRDLEIIIESNREAPGQLVCSRESRDSRIEAKSDSFEYMMIKNILDKSKGEAYFKFVKKMSLPSNMRAIIDMRNFALVHNTLFLYQAGELRTISEMKKYILNLIINNSIQVGELSPADNMGYIKEAIEKI